MMPYPPFGVLTPDELREKCARAGAREKASNARIAALEKAAMELAELLAGGDEGG
jgi:6,7-dimethyl-8-ribityllumazine synthase